jgi:hypothetical protein
VVEGNLLLLNAVRGEPSSLERGKRETFFS